MSDRIAVGQRFRESGRRDVWVVQAVFRRPGEPPHVRLEDERDRHRLKTVGMSALLDRDLFEVVPEAV